MFYRKFFAFVGFTLAFGLAAQASDTEVSQLNGLRAIEVIEGSAPDENGSVIIKFDPDSVAKLREFSRQAIGKRILFLNDGQELAELVLSEPLDGVGIQLMGLSSDEKARMMHTAPLLFDVRLENEAGMDRLNDPHRKPTIDELSFAKRVGETCQGALTALELAELELDLAKYWVSFAKNTTDADARTAMRRYKKLDSNIGSMWRTDYCGPGATSTAKHVVEHMRNSNSAEAK